jgi:tRNA A-37 threonylcarbamoyl transferase component Bud32
MEYTVINENIAVGKEGSVSVVKVKDTVCILKQFKKKKSPARIQKEAQFQMAACEIGVSPQIFHVDLDKKQIFMQGLNGLLLDVAKTRVPPCLLSTEMKSIENLMKSLDNIGVLHNDGNCRNVMIDGGRIYLIDYGFAKKITPSILKKTQEPNIRYTLAMMKRSFKHNGIKAWL